jgi:hypothetical protein
MQDLLVALIVGWILFRLFRPVIFVQWGGKRQPHQYSNSYPPQREGEIKVTQQHSRNSNSNDSGEYVDYEELPPDKKN